MNRKFFLIIFVPFLLYLNAGSQILDTAYSEPDNIDVKLFRYLNNSRNETLDKIIKVTDMSILPVSVITPITLFTVSRINNHTYDENSAVLLALSEITASSSSFLIKNIFKRNRPFRELKNVNHSEDDEIFLDSYSFPSGHSSMAFSFATSLTLRYSDKPALIAGLYSYAMLVSIGRIYLGNHYPSDVLGGMIVGSGSAVLIYSLRSEIISFKNNLFREKYKQDSNNSNLVTPLFLGSIIISDVINYFLLGNNDNVKLNIHSSDNTNYLMLNCNF